MVKKELQKSKSEQAEIVSEFLNEIKRFAIKKLSENQVPSSWGDEELQQWISDLIDHRKQYMTDQKSEQYFEELYHFQLLWGATNQSIVIN